MAVVIRMQRAGGRNHPFYRVVATDSRAGRDGRFLEKIGYYNPVRDPAEIQLELDRIEDWVSKGARVSEGVERLLKYYKDRAAGKVPDKPKARAKAEAKTEPKAQPEARTEPGQEAGQQAEQDDKQEAKQEDQTTKSPAEKPSDA
ncbi:MAG: 30S ribosomal protein S16 [Candidatus Eisenbacteria bacterium]|nr:30S ribosomal protein S16 [Candidatus Latescibacterota bacterium]MBD3301016.1 30S ribosomal protein S16 [Candidatus Eisenbacteria bacterium]